MSMTPEQRDQIEAYMGPIEAGDLALVEGYLERDGHGKIAALRWLRRAYAEMASTPAVHRGGSGSSSHAANLGPLAGLIDRVVAAIIGDPGITLTDEQAAFVAGGGLVGVSSFDLVASDERPGR